MKKLFMWILLLGFCTSYSCKKNNSVPNQNNPEPTLEIIYTDLDPDVERTTISDYYISMNPLCDSFPLPNDSTANYELDLNDDSEADFKIEIKHYQQEINEYCGNCGVFHIKMIKLIPLNNLAYISVDSISNYWINKYDSTAVISASDNWKNESVTALLKDGCMIPSFGFSDTYFGLRLNDRYAWIHLERISYNGIRIKEYAINPNKDQPIKAGQTK